jgi:hypothetical protein
LAFAVPWLVLVGGWQVRNGRVAGTYLPSGGPAKFLALSRGGDIVSQREGIPFAEARERLMHEVTERERRTGQKEDALYLRTGLALAAEHPWLFLRTQVRWLPELLLGTGAAPLLDSMGLGGGAGAEAPALAIRALSVVHLLLVYAAFAWGLGAAARPPREDAGRALGVLLLALLVAYFVVLSTGPQGYSRLRAPLMPLVAVGAGLACADLARGAAALRTGRATSSRPVAAP